MSLNNHQKINKKEIEKRNKRLSNIFWMIRDPLGKDISKPKTHETEKDAWNTIIKFPFNIDDYKAKGYHSVRINMNPFKKEIKEFGKKIDKMEQKGYI